jgi:hypothetical protein
MAQPLTLQELQLHEPTFVQLDTLDDGAPVLQPRLQGNKIVLDLTPGEDDWLPVVQASTSPDQHHKSYDTKALHMMVALSNNDCRMLDYFEGRLMKKVGYEILRTTEGFGAGKMWVNMHRGEGQVLVNLVVGASLFPTELNVIENDRFKEVTTQHFVDSYAPKLKDYCCKIQVEMEFIQEAEHINVVLRALVATFALAAKPSHATHRGDKETKETLLSSAKRMRYRL